MGYQQRRTRDSVRIPSDDGVWRVPSERWAARYEFIKSSVSPLLIYKIKGDGAKLLVALAACLLGYGEVGLWLVSEASKGKDSWVKMEGNKYRKWIEDYGGERYQNAVKTGIGET